MDGSIFPVLKTRLCSRCWRLTWQPDLCLLCQRTTPTPATPPIPRKDA